jgi:hypothetical protein
MQLFSCPGAEVIGQSTKRSSPAAETRPIEVSAEFNSLKTADLLHPLTPAPTQATPLLLGLPMTLSIRFAPAAKLCRDGSKPPRYVHFRSQRVLRPFSTNVDVFVLVFAFVPPGTGDSAMGYHFWSGKRTKAAFSPRVGSQVPQIS